MLPLGTFKVELDTDVPIYRPPYRIPEAYKEEVNKMIKQLLDEGIVEKSAPPYGISEKEAGGRVSKITLGGRFPRFEFPHGSIQPSYTEHHGID